MMSICFEHIGHTDIHVGTMLVCWRCHDMGIQKSKIVRPCPRNPLIVCRAAGIVSRCQQWP